MGKSILSAIVSAIAGFMGGWLIHGVLLMNFMKEAMVPHPGVYNEMPVMWAIALAQVCYGIFYAWFFKTTNVTKFIKGFYMALVPAFLFSTAFDLFVYATMNMYKSFTGYFVDVISSTILGGIMGAFAALILGLGKKA